MLSHPFSVVQFGITWKFTKSRRFTNRDFVLRKCKGTNEQGVSVAWPAFPNLLATKFLPVHPVFSLHLKREKSLKGEKAAYQIESSDHVSRDEKNRTKEKEKRNQNPVVLFLLKLDMPFHAYVTKLSFVSVCWS